ncbi:hypothetical protein XPA_007907 [Xanthoria parietina]
MYSRTRRLDLPPQLSLQAGMCSTSTNNTTTTIVPSKPRRNRSFRLSIHLPRLSGSSSYSFDTSVQMVDYHPTNQNPILSSNLPAANLAPRITSTMPPKTPLPSTQVLVLSGPHFKPQQP